MVCTKSLKEVFQLIFFLRMLLPSIYKDSLEGGAASLRPFLAKRWTFSTRGHKNAYCSYAVLFRVWLIFAFELSHMAVLPFCLFYHFPSKYFASSGRLCQTLVGSLKDCIPLICGIRLLLWQTLFTTGEHFTGWAIPTSFPPSPPRTRIFWHPPQPR